MTRLRSAPSRIGDAPAAMNRRGGFTILEVVLTLSMAVVLMSLVGATLQFYSRNMNVRDMDVRRVHLAASVLQMMADDLRATIRVEPFDSSALEGFLSGAAGGVVSESLDPAAAETLGIAAPGSTLEEPSMVDSTTNLGGSTLTLQRPGMIGNQSEIQFDISRLPRLEQWQQTLSESPSEIADIPSDHKTVTYYVQPAGATGGVNDPLQNYLPQTAEANTGVAPGGLVRRELDRAANKWAVESGGIGGLLTTGDLVATEIAAVEFSYFDGIQWQIFWNSDDMQGLPMAVQIKITLADAAPASDDVSAGSSARSFTQIIPIPAGRAAPLDTTGTTTGSTDTTGTTGTAEAMP